MNISIASSNYTAISKAGFYGVDFNFANHTMRDLILSDGYEALVTEKYNALTTEGLKVCQTHLTFWPGHIPPIEDGTYQAFEDYMLPLLIKEIELTAKMGCPTAVIHLYFEKDKEASRKGNIQLIKKLMPYLEKNNVILSLENIFGPEYCDIHLSTASDFMFYFDYFKSPYLGMCLDTGHAVILGQNPLEIVEPIKDKLTALHVNTTVPGIDLHKPPYGVSYGEQIDWEKFYSLLKKVDYKGTFNMELSLSPQIGEKAQNAFYCYVFEIADNIVSK